MKLTQAKKIVKAFAKHAARSDVRFYLRGVRFDHGKMVATDGHRLAILTSPKIASVSRALDGCTVATSPRNLEALAEILANSNPGTEMSFDKETGVLKTHWNSFLIDNVDPQNSNFGDVRYPDYKRLIPSEADIKASFDVFAYNAKYISDACSLVSAVHTQHERLHMESVNHSSGQPIAIVRIDEDGTEGMVIIMPVKL